MRLSRSHGLMKMLPPEEGRIQEKGEAAAAREMGQVCAASEMISGGGIHQLTFQNIEEHPRKIYIVPYREKGCYTL